MLFNYSRRKDSVNLLLLFRGMCLLWLFCAFQLFSEACFLHSHPCHYYSWQAMNGPSNASSRSKIEHILSPFIKFCKSLLLPLVLEVWKLESRFSGMAMELPITCFFFFFPSKIKMPGFLAKLVFGIVSLLLFLIVL